MKKIIILFCICMNTKVATQVATFSHADSLLAKGRYRLALTELKSIDTLQNISNYKIGAIYTAIDAPKKAIEFYKKSLSFKKDLKAAISLAKAYQKTKQYLKAIKIYEQIREEDPENLLVSYQLGKLYFATNNLKEARKTFKLLSQKDRQNPNYHYQLGLIAARKFDGNGMLDNFLRAYKADQTHIKSVYQLAKTFAQLRKRDSSRIFTDIGLQLDSLHINLNKLKINEHFRNKRYKEAITKLQLLDTLYSSDLYVKKMLGRSYFNIDSLVLAEKNFKTATTLDKEDFKIDLYLGHIYKSRKKYRKAMLSYFRATSKGKKSRDEEYYSLGMLYLEMKQPKSAVAMFDRALRESSKKYQAFYQKALTYDSHYKDKKKAYDLYDEYILRFEEKDKDISLFVKNRMKELKKELFFKGEKVE